MAKKIVNLDKLSEQDLQKRVFDLQHEIREIRFKDQGAKSKDVNSTSKIKREIARALTKLNKINKKTA